MNCIHPPTLSTSSRALMAFPTSANALHNQQQESRPYSSHLADSSNNNNNNNSLPARGYNSMAMTCSQRTTDDAEDDEVHQLEVSGALTQVIGSQSILSQEICRWQQYGHDNHDVIQPDTQSSVVSLAAAAHPALMIPACKYPARSISTSHENNQSQDSYARAKAVARCYGLLTQEDEAVEGDADHVTSKGSDDCLVMGMDAINPKQQQDQQRSTTTIMQATTHDADTNANANASNCMPIAAVPLPTVSRNSIAVSDTSSSNNSNWNCSQDSSIVSLSTSLGSSFSMPKIDLKSLASFASCSKENIPSITGTLSQLSAFSQTQDHDLDDDNKSTQQNHEPAVSQNTKHCYIVDMVNLSQSTTQLAMTANFGTLLDAVEAVSMQETQHQQKRLQQHDKEIKAVNKPPVPVFHPVPYTGQPHCKRRQQQQKRQGESVLSTPRAAPTAETAKGITTAPATTTVISRASVVSADSKTNKRTLPNSTQYPKNKRSKPRVVRVTTDHNAKMQLAKNKQQMESPTLSLTFSQPLALVSHRATLTKLYQSQKMTLVDTDPKPIVPSPAELTLRKPFPVPLPGSAVAQTQPQPSKIKSPQPLKTIPPMSISNAASDSGRAKPQTPQKNPLDKMIVTAKGKEAVAVLSPTRSLAHQAADLAARTFRDPELAKKLLLSMAMTRDNPRQRPDKIPGPGHQVPAGFYWAHYPPFETVLRSQMTKYFYLSMRKCQSGEQQEFNNTLVFAIRNKAKMLGWTFDEQAFGISDKILRDRIRCWYKTHIQNSKKRLKTMLRNPTKRANAIHLMQHADLIRQAAMEQSRRDQMIAIEEEKKTKKKAPVAASDKSGVPSNNVTTAGLLPPPLPSQDNNTMVTVETDPHNKSFDLFAPDDE